MHFDHRKHLRTYSNPDTAPGLQERAAPGPKKPAGGSPHINWLHRSLSAGLLLLVPNWAGAQPTAHYCPGSEGLNGASVPPPGLYLRDYNMFYTSCQVNDSAGRSVGPANYNVFTYAQVPRLIWISNTKFLGADVGADTLLPLVDENVTAGGYHSSTFGAGDLLMAGILAWHPQRFDFVLCDGPWIPTGDSAAPPTTRAGLGYWGDMLTAGATWHVDADKTWNVSVLNRYEFNGKQRDTHITPGQAWTMEWGIGKTFQNKMDAGVAGYYQQKITADSGPNANYNRVAAVGPEISGLIPKTGVEVSLRYLYEFLAENRAQGHTITLTLTKRF